MKTQQFLTEYSFLATLAWQGGTTRNLYPVGVGLDLRLGAASNDGWLHAGEDRFTEREIVGGRYVRQKINSRFWFGCYLINDTFHYEVRAGGIGAGDTDWTFRGYRLEASRNGYLGLYRTHDAVGHDPVDAGSSLWKLNGLNPRELEAGRGYPGLEMLGMHFVFGNSVVDRPVRRWMKSGYPYLNEQAGESGELSVNVLRVGVAAP